MMEKLTQLTETDIRARSSETSFARGQAYYTGGAIRRRLRHPTSLVAQVEGQQTYQVTVWVKANGEIGARCTCPYDHGGDCKHIVATLLAWLNEPESFQPPVDLKSVLDSRSKAELVALLLDILSVYPHLVDDFDLVTGSAGHELPQKAAEILQNLQPWGHLSEEEAEAHMRLIAGRAARLAEQGQTDLARRIYYALIVGCVDLCRSYGSDDYFSANVPYDFAVAYDDLAVEQVKEQGATIKAELDEIFRDLYDPDRLGLNEALAGTWCELMDQGFVEGYQMMG